jgi:pyruvate ferredoxin oxidoreductase delta subunit
MPKQLPTWKEVSPGGMIVDPGSTASYNTGTWRAFRPVHDMDKCTHCLICWINCPDSSIVVQEGRWAAFDYDHCKGCGICANVCPINKDEPHAVTGKPGTVIQMVIEKD